MGVRRQASGVRPACKPGRDSIALYLAQQPEAGSLEPEA